MAGTKELMLRGSVLRVGLLIANLAVAFYLMPFLIHALGNRWYGMWTLIGTIVSYYGFLDFGLSIAAQRFVANRIELRNDTEINRCITTALFVFSAIGVAMLGVTGVIVGSASSFLTVPDELETFRWTAALLGLNIALSFPVAAFNGLITGHLRFDLVSYIELAKLVVRTGLIVYFVNRGYSILALAAITLVTDLGSNLLRVLVARRLFRQLEIHRNHFDRPTLGSLFGYGWRTFLNQLAEIMRFHVDHLVIAAFINLSAVTIFNIAGQLVFYFRNFMSAVMGVLLPVYSRYHAANDREAVYRTFFFTSKLAGLLAVFMGGTAIVFGRDFIRLWMGEEYGAAYSLLVIIMVPMVLFVAQSPGHTLIYGFGEVGNLAKASLLESFANVILSLLLVGPLGLVGVALGTAIPLSALTAFLLIFSCRLAGGTLTEYFRRVGPVLGVGMGVQVVAGAVFSSVTVTSYLDLIVWFLVLYPALIAVTVMVTFSAAERDLMRRTGLRVLGLRAGAET